MENSTENTQPAGKTVSAAAVLALLQSGKTRKEIKAELGLTWGQMAQVFQHPGLKGRRTLVSRRPSVFQVIDDLPVATSDAGTADEAPASTDTASEDTSAANVEGASTDAESDLASNTDLDDTAAYEAAGASDDVIDASATQEEEEQDDRPPFERFGQ